MHNKVFRIPTKFITAIASTYYTTIIIYYTFSWEVKCVAGTTLSFTTTSEINGRIKVCGAAIVFNARAIHGKCSANFGGTTTCVQ